MFIQPPTFGILYSSFILYPGELMFPFLSKGSQGPVKLYFFNHQYLFYHGRKTNTFGFGFIFMIFQKLRFTQFKKKAIIIG